MINFLTDSGCLSGVGRQPASPPVTSPLRSALASNDPRRVEAEMNALEQSARAGGLASSRLCQTLLAPDIHGDSPLLHAARDVGRVDCLRVLLEGIERLAGQGLLDRQDTRALLCARDADQEAPLHVLAFDPAGAAGLAAYGATLHRLHADGRLSDGDLAAVLLQDAPCGTPCQCVLRRGKPAAINAMLQMLAQALDRGAVSGKAACDALAAPHAPAPANRRPWATAPTRAPLHAPFEAADLAAMQAIVTGIDAWLATGRVATADLREALALPLARTGSFLNPAYAGNAPALRHANAIAGNARQRWFGDSPAAS